MRSFASKKALLKQKKVRFSMLCLRFERSEEKKPKYSLNIRITSISN